MERNVIVDDLDAVHANEVRGLTRVIDKVWSVEHDGSIAMRSVQSAELEGLIESRAKEHAWCILKRYAHVWVGFDTGIVRIFSAENRRLIKESSEHAGTVCALATTKSWVFSASTDREVFQWHPESFHVVHAFQGHNGPVRCLIPVGNDICSGADDATLRVWDPESRTCRQQLRGHKGAVLAVDISHGSNIWSGSEDTSVRVWNSKSYKLMATLSQHNGAVTCLANAGDFVLSGSFDCSICMWDSRSFQCIHSLLNHGGPISEVSFVSAAVKYTFWSTSKDKTIRRWTFEICGGALERVACSNLELDHLDLERDESTTTEKIRNNAISEKVPTPIAKNNNNEEEQKFVEERKNMKHKLPI